MPIVAVLRGDALDHYSASWDSARARPVQVRRVSRIGRRMLLHAMEVANEKLIIVLSHHGMFQLFTKGSQVSG